MPPLAFAAMAGGGLWLLLWESRARLLGLLPLCAGAVAALLVPTPDLLVTGDGRHLAVVERGVPHLLRDRTGDYMRDLLSEAAGFDQEPLLLAENGGASCSGDSCIARLERSGRAWILLATRSSQRIDWAPLVRGCAQADIVVADRRLPRGCNPRWLKLDRAALARTGGVAIYLGDEPQVRTVAERLGNHPWAQRVGQQTQARRSATRVSSASTRERADAAIRDRT